MGSDHKNAIEQKTALFGLQPSTIGKTEARQRFFPLVDELSHGAKALAITDHQKPIAVLVGYNQWSALISKLDMFMKSAKKLPTKVNMVGSVKIIGDLEASSQRSAERFQKAIEKSARTLRQELK